MRDHPAPGDQGRPSRDRRAVRAEGLRVTTVRLIGCAFASMLACPLVVVGCTLVDEPPRSACEQDESLCPPSSQTATDLACDCRCVVGWPGIASTRTFTGVVSACLPPSLNTRTASTGELATIQAMPPTQYNQRVYSFCHDTVAHFLGSLIEEQQRPRDLRSACLGPRVRCACETAGAQEATRLCSQPCEDLPCARDNCPPLLRVGGSIDTATCACSRVDGCGESSPPSDHAALCTNRIAASIRRATMKRRRPRLHQGVPRRAIQRWLLV